jgi:hypothetical protein
MWFRSARPLLCLAALSVACSTKEQQPIADSGDSTTGSDPVDASSGGSSGSGSDESTGDPVFEPYPARGIKLKQVNANQAVAIPIVKDGEWVEGPSRNAEIIRNRHTLIRAFWELAEDFQPRKIDALLTLEYDDGTEEIARKSFMIEGESTEQDLNASIWFMIPADLVKARMKFKIELFETEPGYEDVPVIGPESYPPQAAYLGVEDAEMVLRALLVPIKHELNDECPEPADITEDAAQVFADQLYLQNPVQRADVEVREPFVFTDTMNSFGKVLSALADLRETDGADPSVYYYGIVRPCDGGPDGVGGQAISIPNTPRITAAWERTAVGRWYTSPLASAGTFVHEVGHTQGRYHVACSGGEGGPDPSYPYEDGDIGVWGFELLIEGENTVKSLTFHSPTAAKDYMTYCGNTWISDWGWHKVFPVIKTITSWDADASNGAPAAAPGDQRLLVGLIDPRNDSESWFVTRGTSEGRTPLASEALEISTPTDNLSLPMTIGSMGDDDAYNVVVQLPPDLDVARATQIARVSAGARRNIDEVRVSGQVLRLR